MNFGAAASDYNAAASHIEILRLALEKAEELNLMGQNLKNEVEVCAYTDGPLDSLSHQIQFVVTYSGSASATWTLTKIVGPGPAALPSGTYAGTHTLTIVLAPANSDNAENKRQALSFNAALQRLVTTPAP